MEPVLKTLCEESSLSGASSSSPSRERGASAEAPAPSPPREQSASSEASAPSPLFKTPKESSTTGASTNDPEGAPSGEPLEDQVSNLTLQGPKRRNRTGAEKKRWRKAKAAAAGSNQPVSKPGPSTSKDEGNRAGGTKRGLSDSGTPPSAQKTVKKARAVLKPASYSQAANSAMRVAISEFNYPDIRLTNDQADSIQRALDSIVEALPLGDPQSMFLPRFDEFRWSEMGVIYVTCADEPSKIWLKDNVAKLQPWKDAKLRVLEGETLPRLKKLIAHVNGAPSTNDRIFKLLQLYNPGLRTDLWKVRDRHEEPHLVRLVLGVDEASARIIEAQGYKAYAGVARVQFTDPKQTRGSEGLTEGPKEPQVVASTEVSAEGEGGH